MLNAELTYTPLSNQPQSVVYLDTTTKGCCGLDSGQLSGADTSSPGSVADSGLGDLVSSSSGSSSSASCAGVGGNSGVDMACLARMKSVDSSILLTPASSSQPSPSSQLQQQFDQTAALIENMVLDSHNNNSIGSGKLRYPPPSVLQQNQNAAGILDSLSQQQFPPLTGGTCAAMGGMSTTTNMSMHMPSSVMSNGVFSMSGQTSSTTPTGSNSLLSTYQPVGGSMGTPHFSQHQQSQQQLRDLLSLKELGQGPNVGQSQFSPVTIGINNQHPYLSPTSGGAGGGVSKADFGNFNLMLNSFGNGGNSSRFTNNGQRNSEIDKDDKLNSWWGFGDGVENVGSAGTGGPLSQGGMGSGASLYNPMIPQGGKRPITGGHSLMRSASGGSGAGIGASLMPGGCSSAAVGGGRNIWGVAGGSASSQQQPPIGPQTSMTSNSNSGLVNGSHKPWLPTQATSPWSQALANQKLGLAPTPVNAMNLGNFGGRQTSSGSNCMNGGSGPSMTGPPTTVPVNHSMYNMFPKKPQHRLLQHHHQQQAQHQLGPVGGKFDFSAIGGSGGGLPSSGVGDPGLGNQYDQFGHLEKTSPLDTFKFGLDHQLMEVIKSMDGGGGPGSGSGPLLDDAGSDQFGLMGQYPLFSGGIPQREERYSRKVFVGGLPPDIDEEEITAAFRRFGPLIVDWPHKAESKSYFPPKGYCFLLFQDELSVQNLIEACIMDECKYYWCVSSPTIKDKPVQIRPWNLSDSDFVMDGSQPLDPRKTIFVGGVPRPLRAIELAMIMDRLYGGVCYAGIDTDPELKYPKGAGRVAFSNQQSYIAAISARFVQLQYNDIDKRVEVKPYVLDDQMCDECQGARCNGKFAPFFCANVTCLQYYCEQCWVQIHSRQGRDYHKPLVKEGADRPRTVPFRW